MRLAIDSTTIALLTNKSVRHIFKQVVESRRARLGEISDRASAEDKTMPVEQALESLKQAELIEEQDSPIDSLRTFYPTAKGLDAERELRKMPIRDEQQEVAGA
ncbi:MAG: hypothetical protein O2968_21745 [Acidobacteria bacterium]|nr:hypothetical protein [Acidobacteriota bacterium]